MTVQINNTVEGAESTGAIFHRCALQVNPGHYLATFRGGDVEGDAKSYADAIVQKACDAGVSVLAITDHNNVNGVSAFRAAALNCGITVFPGFELSSSEGVHVLCIYPPESREEQLGRHLGYFGIQGIEPSTELSSKNVVEIVEAVHNQGGIAVAAHATNNSGLLRKLGGKPRVRAWTDENLLAIQIPSSISSLDPADRKIVENKNPDYHRTRMVAAINAKDITKCEDLDDPSSNCLIKMSEVTVEGLRQAFLDPESRVRLNSDPLPEEHTELMSITWEGGFLGGITINFNSNLNVLIGGRGAGKSAVVESLRYVLDLKPVGEEARKLHEEIVRRVLRSGTKVSLKVRSHRPAKSEYLIERIINNPPVIRDTSGQVSKLRSTDILPNVEVYGQHEISELTRSPEKLTRLLDRFVVRNQDLERRKDAVQKSLQETRESILEAASGIESVDELLAKLPGLEETLSRYQAAGLEERLREQSLLVREERVIASVTESIQPFENLLQSLQQKLPIDRAFLTPESLEELPGKEILSDGNGILSRLSDQLEEAARQIQNAIDKARAETDTTNSRWGERKAEVEASFQSILRELGQSAVDGEEFIQLRREIEGLIPLRERRVSSELRLREHQARRHTLLADWEDIKAEEFRQLDRAAKTVGRNLSAYVQVEVSAAGNKEPLFDLLRAQIGGRLSETIAKINQMPDFSLPTFNAVCRQGPGEIQKAYSIPLTQATALAGASLDALMQIEELELLPTTAIRLNIAAAGSTPVWQELDKLSTGQKSTAVLLLLLLESDAPLIVDQPEDDLDNRFITEGVVPKMRDGKRRRQFVFSSHNANIPVLGDAELILGMTASGSGEIEEGRARIAPEHMGSIDAKPVRDLVGQILEGGKEAFETRRLKYGF